MLKRKHRTQRGFTLIELAMAAAISTIVILGVGVLLVDSQRGWIRMYNRIYSDVVTDSYVARKTFDVVIRLFKLLGPEGIFYIVQDVSSVKEGEDVLKWFKDNT